MTVREGNGNPLQYSCLETPMDGGAWWAAVHGVVKSRTQLRDFTFTFHFHALEKEMATHSSVGLENPGMSEPGGLPSMGSHRVGHDWSDLAGMLVLGKAVGWGDRLPDSTLIPCWPVSSPHLSQPFLKRSTKIITVPTSECFLMSRWAMDSKHWTQCGTQEMPISTTRTSTMMINKYLFGPISISKAQDSHGLRDSSFSFFLRLFHSETPIAPLMSAATHLGVTALKPHN